jgi:hypothetical protein
MVEIQNERDYIIRKGKVMEKFTMEFCERNMRNPEFRAIYEGLDIDPYEIIERLINSNVDLFHKLKVAMELMPQSSYTIFQQKITTNDNTTTT